MTFRNPTDFADAGRTDPGLLLDALQKQAIERVVPALDRALGRVLLTDHLGQHWGHDHGGGQHRVGQGHAAALAQRFEQALISGFRALRDPRAASAMLGEHSGLSLLSEDALEEQLANEQLAESMSRMHAPSLELLGKRIAHVLGRDELKATDNPLAPAFIAAAMRKAVEAAEVDPGVRIVVFKFFERELANALAHAYERSNTLLVAAGVLPQLRATSKAEAMPAAALPGEAADATGGSGHGQPGRVAPARRSPWVRMNW